MDAMGSALIKDVDSTARPEMSSSQSHFYVDAHRQDLLQQINHHWKYSGCVLLCGAPGVGKTALLKQVHQTLSEDVLALYIDGKVLGAVDDILSYALDAYSLDGGPLKTRREMAEKLLQFAELESEMGRDVVLFIDHFDNLSESSQRYLWQLYQLPHNQLKLVLAADSYYQECLEVFGVVEHVPLLVLQPLHAHKIIHYLNDCLAEQGVDIHALMSAKALEDWVVSAKGNIALLEASLPQLIAQYQSHALPKSPLSSTVVALVAITLMLTGGVYVFFVGSDEEMPRHDRAAEVASPAPVQNAQEPESTVLSEEQVVPLEDNTVKIEDKAPSQTVEMAAANDADTPISTATLSNTEASSEPAVVIEELEAPLEKPLRAAVDEPAVITATVLPVTIQLMGVYDRERLGPLVDAYPDLPIEIQETRRSGRPWFILLYGSFHDKTAARAAIPSIPAKLRPSDPWIRMRADIQ